jgi:hypothetical protein
MEQSTKSFVLTWERAENVQEVCDLCDMSAKSASNMASYLRKKGIPLKKMKAKGSRLGWPAHHLKDEDIEELKLLVEKIAGAREVEKRYRNP